MKNIEKFISLVEQMEKLFIEEMTDEEAKVVSSTAEQIDFDIYRIKRWKVELKKQMENL